MHKFTIKWGSNILAKTTKTAGIVEVFPFPRRFNDFEYSHDLAVVFVDQPIEFNENIQSVLLSNHTLMTGGKISVFGIGAENGRRGGKVPSRLKSADLRLWSETDCNEYVWKTPAVNVENGTVLCLVSVGATSCYGNVVR